MRLAPHPLLLAVLPPLSSAEIERAEVRVRLYGQRETIEVVGSSVVSGLEEFEGCRAAKVTPKVTQIEEPDDLIEYVCRRLPRQLTTLDRAVIAVLSEEQWKERGRVRMREAGRIGGQSKGRGNVPRPFGNELWFESAAKVVGTSAGAVKRLAGIRRAAPDVFQAVRDRKVIILRDARDLAQSLPTAKARAKVLALRAKNPTTPVSRLVADVMRAERPALGSSSKDPKSGNGWAVHEGPMDREGRAIGSGTVDLVFADVIYGNFDMADSVSKLAKRVLVDGGVLAMIAGHEVSVVMNVLAKHLTPIAVGSYIIRNNGNAKWPGPVTRLDALPVLFFVKGKRRTPLAHLAFTSENKEKTWHGWAKNTAAMQDIIASCVPSGARVMDPCCGGGTTGEAALRHGCEFVGIDVDTKAVQASRSRLAAVERELGDTNPLPCLSPFFCYFGAKFRSALKYPAPTHDTIIEPFAGAAGYATRYANRKVILVERDPTIAGLWRYLTRVSAREILSLPDVPPGETAKDLKICEEARSLVGFWIKKGNARPARAPSKWARERPNSFWGSAVREKLAAQVDAIRHWKIIEGSYEKAPNVKATWFVDPPYERAGKNYRYTVSDFQGLSEWCRSRRGQVLVCEQEGASWLPFQPFAMVKATQRGRGNAYSSEVLWVAA